MAFPANKAAMAAVGIPAAMLMGIRLCYPTIRDDIAFFRRSRHAVKAMNDLRARNQKVVDTFEDQAQSRPNKPFILYKDECHTFGQVDRDANKMAHYMQESGLQLRDTVAFLLPNAPVYVSSFLACNKIGVTAAFVNYNLKHQALLHCIQISDANIVLCSKEYIQKLQYIQEDIEQLNIKIWVIGCEDVSLPPRFTGMDLSNISAEPIPREIRKSLTMSDPGVYIYTSGTTGLPKAVIMTQFRLVKGTFLSHACGFTSDDVIYCPLPIYHGSGFAFGVLTAIRIGCTITIAPKFSASHFWDDVRRYRATGIQYIGELCRYLLAQPPRHDDGKYPHTVRIAVGNGLRPDIWAQFKKRFNIEHIREFYSATEGNFVTTNTDDTVGPCGKYPNLVRDLVGNVHIIKCDMANAEPIRGKNGHCIRQPSGETGLLVVKITDFSKFDGYKGSKETNEKKIVRDVIKKGDQYFNTGDLMMIDSNGYLYFCDRLGDTFRWKGENVATTEVAEELNRFPSILDSNVYGVKVPGQDGRAGMAAITLREGQNLNPEQLFKHATENLPSYACPKFLRILPQLVITSTFKHKKTDLLKEGFDPAVVSDPLYFMDIGCTVAIAPKFSASHYWDDVRRYRATGILYIGELCRYLLAQPPRHDDGKYPHTVRIAVGNGLRPDIWAQFKKRFNIEHIREFYAATEGNFIAMNLDDKEGTVGRYPKLVHDLLGNAQIIKCDMATAEPIRGKNGHCIPQPSGEMGLLVTKIDDFFSFDGYKASKETNEKKIIHDVIKKGDQYFNTGDLMMIDNNGYVYFCDRLGDTFRWKGENVATTEVAEELNKFPGILDSNVYGVKIPGQDGRAGMAAITMKEGHNLDPQQLFKHATDNLPSYACPKFLRILPQLVITSTFKHKKTDLLKEGFDPAVVSDPLYFMDVGKKTYVPLDRQVFQTIVAGKAKL